MPAQGCSPLPGSTAVPPGTTLSISLFSWHPLSLIPQPLADMRDIFRFAQCKQCPVPHIIARWRGKKTPPIGFLTGQESPAYRSLSFPLVVGAVKMVEFNKNRGALSNES